MMDKTIKVTISVGGRFHAFNLAQQLLKRGFLERLITSFPKFEVKKYGLPGEKIKSVVIKEILERSWRKMPFFLRNSYNPEFFIAELYDHLAARQVLPSDIFVGFASFALHSMAKAKKTGALTLLERGNSHITFHNNILKEEHELCGVKNQLSLSHPKTTEKELSEYEETDYITVPSSFVRKTFLDFGFPEKKLIQVPYCVDLSLFRQIPKKDDIFRVIFIGGMNLRKGVHYLLRAFAELNLPKSELLLVGSISDEIKPFFKKYSGKFRWTGHISHKELYKYYSGSSVFVLNSIEDGFGMVMAQAMACGLPAICTTNTGGPDVVREGKDGFIIPIRDVEVLKEKLVYLYENPEICRQMGQSAKDRVSQGFTWDDYGNKIVREYERILYKSS